jgi:hypothetical protein
MLSLVAAHGAEYKAVNELIQKGSKPEDIVLLPPIFIWPDEGPF